MLPLELSLHREQTTVDGLAVVVRPGDTLIVRIASHATREEVQELADIVKGGLPAVRVLVINAEQLLVYRPSAERESSRHDDVVSG